MVRPTFQLIGALCAGVVYCLDLLKYSPGLLGNLACQMVDKPAAAGRIDDAVQMSLLLQYQSRVASDPPAESVREPHRGIERHGRNRFGSTHPGRENSHGVTQQIHIGINASDYAITHPGVDSHRGSGSLTFTSFDYSGP